MLDVLPEDRLYWDMIINKAIDLAGRYGFQRINVPIIEKDELFSRGVGEASDFFVKKEMYTIQNDFLVDRILTASPAYTALCSRLGGYFCYRSAPLRQVLDTDEPL